MEHVMKKEALYFANTRQQTTAHSQPKMESYIL